MTTALLIPRAKARVAAAHEEPLPDFDGPADAEYHRQQFAAAHVGAFARFINGNVTAHELRQMWLDYRQRVLENRRFDNWCRKNRLKWDEQANAYAIPSNPPTP